MLDKITHTIEPVYDENSKILILGTMPSPKSREVGFYYGHSQNRFWPIMSEIFSIVKLNNNEDKIIFLKEHNIALWDVLKSCEIKGAEDSSIKNPKANDINNIIKNSHIKSVFTTGKKATDLYKKHCYPNTGIESIYLPSTSSANRARYSYEDLIDEYKRILDYL
ncbi:DNA-deoxyinosine glycosylase [Metaclostridioides mangenotii]|uniref:DNA-deoxyinosine glycosylase n=1 Tax=Metaclostridioides mangenotii TaxID=1540 RepID=UPI000465E4C4|nr:DNA-deoxyinosine glycosylase [Clostridioides mangenotii]